MVKRTAVSGLLLMFALLAWPQAGYSAEDTGPAKKGKTGLFEVDCNIAGIELSLCPAENFEERETKAFFGLIKSSRWVCSGGEISIGTTPLRPVPVQAGDYILMIPSDYAWEKEGPIQITVQPGEKTYFLLKLFTTSSTRPEDDRGGGGGGGGGGGAGAR